MHAPGVGVDAAQGCLWGLEHTPVDSGKAVSGAVLTLGRSVRIGGGRGWQDGGTMSTGDGASKKNWKYIETSLVF